MLRKNGVAVVDEHLKASTFKGMAVSAGDSTHMLWVLQRDMVRPKSFESPKPMHSTCVTLRRRLRLNKS